MSLLAASKIASEYGFTARHWIRQAAHGKVPGAYQPSGQGGKWLFDAIAFGKWFKEKNRRVESWQGHTKEVKSIGRVSKEKVWNTEPPLRQLITKLHKDVSKNGLKNLRPSAGASGNVLPLQRP